MLQGAQWAVLTHSQAATRPLLSSSPCSQLLKTTTIFVPFYPVHSLFFARLTFSAAQTE